MFSNLRARFSSAHIIAAVALFVVLGGTAYAAKDLITGKEVAKSTLTGKNVKNGSLKPADLNKKALRSLTGAKGEAGATGATGATGQTGQTGAAGADGIIAPQFVSADPLLNINANTEVTVLTKNVPSGRYVVNASVDVFSQGSGVGGCNLLAGGTTIDDAGFNETAGSTSTRASLSLLGVTSAGITQLKVSCAAGTSPINATSVNLTAIPVG